jgi:hypothetical protein
MTGILSSRDFQKAAIQRLTISEYLFDGDFTLDAFYLAGYSVECILKALIMHLTLQENRQEVFEQLKAGARMHYPEHLKEKLKQLGHPIPDELVKGYRRFAWSTDLRYESGRRPRSEVRGYMKIVQKTIEWAKGEMK